MSDLPSGWSTANLREILEFKYGKGLIKEKRNGHGSVNVYGSGGIVGTHDESITQGATIIVGRKGSVGEVSYSSERCWPIDTTYFIDDFPCELPPNFWARYLKSLRLGQQDKSSAIPGISREDIYKTEILLPPLNEQQRIVEKLEKLLSIVDACQKRLEKIPRILKRFRQSVLAAACSGRLTADWRESHHDIDKISDRLEKLKLARLSISRSEKEKGLLCEKFKNPDLQNDELPAEWLLLSAECICDFITKGTTPAAQEITQNGDIPFLKVYNIINNKIDFFYNPSFVSFRVHETLLSRSKVYPKDVIMNIVGPPLNKVAIIPDDFPQWNINQALAIFRPVKGVLSEFLYIFLSHEGTIEHILRETRGIVGQSNISLEQCRNLIIPVPSLAEQQEIVRRVEALFKVADQIEARYNKAKAHVDKLAQSILAKAFRGELVPQDPNDEPASALLERIRAERATSAPASKKARPLSKKKQASLFDKA